MPFVGCPSDGQQGPETAPKSGKAPRIIRKAAKRLSWYSDGNGDGVLAPRGWHCLALYGSDGSFLIVTPKMHPAGDYFGSKHVELKGPVVQRLYNFGGTSGRFAVINAIGRYFPRYRSFIRDVQKMDLIMDPVPSGPYPHDLVRRQSDRFIRFTTPGHETGEGTRWLIAAGDQPVQGTRELIGPTKEPDLIGLNVRLSRADADLTSYILTNVK